MKCDAKTVNEGHLPQQHANKIKTKSINEETSNHQYLNNLKFEQFLAFYLPQHIKFLSAIKINRFFFVKLSYSYIYSFCLHIATSFLINLKIFFKRTEFKQKWVLHSAPFWGSWQPEGFLSSRLLTTCSICTVQAYLTFNLTTPKVYNHLQTERRKNL